jgi:probable HAF family extracellular repeat protein
MKSRTLTCITAITLFAVLVLPAQLAAQQTQYKLIELGTFEGPSSGFVGVGAHPLNNAGVATGFADTPTPDPNAPNCFGDCSVGHTFQWRKGVLTDLGMLPGVNSGGPNDINANGVVTGISENSVIDPLTGSPEFDAVVWKDGHIINLGTFGGNFSYANAINDRGQVTGFALNTTPDSFGLEELCMNPPFAQQMRAFIWQGGELQDLGTLGGPDSCALFINQSGQATGHSFTNSVVSPLTGFPITHPFLWNGSTMLDLGTLGGTFGVANWLNNRGQVVGFSNLAGDLTGHPFLASEAEGMKDLGTLGGSFGFASSVSDAGDIVGGATNQNDQAFLAFVWKNGVITDLGSLQGDDCSFATNVNSVGQIVGASFPWAGGPSRAFLWERGSIIDLNTLVPPGSDLQLTEATFINDRGEISVQGLLPDGDTRAVLLVPCGEGEEGCQDTASRAAALSRATPSPITQRPPTVSPANPTLRGGPRAMLDRVRSRWGQRYHIPGALTRRGD